MRYKGRDIFTYHLPMSGIEYSAELEWRLVARYFYYRWEQFCALTGETQSSLVAAYRADRYIEAVLEFENAKKMRSNAGRR